MMSDRILLQNMVFYGYHGVHEHEQEHGQRFYIDLEMEADLGLAGKTDDLVDTVDYTLIYSIVKDIVETRRFRLLEALADHIATAVLTAGSLVSAVTVRVRKPAVPIPGSLDYVQIEVTRRLGT